MKVVMKPFNFWLNYFELWAVKSKKRTCGARHQNYFKNGNHSTKRSEKRDSLKFLPEILTRKVVFVVDILDLNFLNLTQFVGFPPVTIVFRFLR